MFEYVVYIGMTIFLISSSSAFLVYREIKKFELKIEIINELIKKKREELRKTLKENTGKIDELKDEQLDDIAVECSRLRTYLEYPVMGKRLLLLTSIWLFVFGFAVAQVSIAVYSELFYLSSYYSSYMIIFATYPVYQIYNYGSQYMLIVGKVKGER